MRILVISDIHANLAAFEAVLQDAQGEWDFVWCLGDVVGYGPDPNECCDLLRSLPHLCLAGNHDWAALARTTEDLGYSTLFVPDHFDDQLAPVPALQAAADAKLNKLKATLEANLGFIYGAEAKVKGLVDISGTLSGNVSGLVEIKAACLPAVAKAIDGAVTDIGVSVQVTGSIVGSIK